MIFLNENEENYKDLRNNLSRTFIYTRTFFSMFIPMSSQRYISLLNDADLKSNFHIIFKTYKEKKQLEISLGKNQGNHETIRNKTSVFEQKPIEVDDFNEIKEKQV